MKKLFKLSVIAIVVICSFLMIKVFADNKVEVKKYVRSSGFSAVLYSNNKLYFWGRYSSENKHKQQNIIIENVKEIYKMRNDAELFIIDNDNTILCTWSDSDVNVISKELEIKIGRYPFLDICLLTFKIIRL